MASESLSRGVDLFFAQEFCFFKQEHGPPRGSKQAKTDVLLTTVLGPLRSHASVTELIAFSLTSVYFYFYLLNQRSRRHTCGSNSALAGATQHVLDTELQGEG